MSRSPLLELEAFGQSIWIDFISRGMITSGELRRMIKEDGVSGVTSNPSIFEKAISQSHDYDDDIRAMAQHGKTAGEIYRSLTVKDIRMVADLLRPVYDRTDGRDGFVSLEVSPLLAQDTRGTVEEARLLWKLVDRPNAMIKVPATAEGIPAIRQLVSEGININITLLFGLPRYREVANAYLDGLESLAAAGGDVKYSASVASFFLSRIDVLLDPQLAQMESAGGPAVEAASGLRGQVAIASAKMAYQIYKEMFTSQRFIRLADKGARTQRLLWASTSTKNPAESDTKYIEPLIGPKTINTVPVETLEAYRDHGHPQRSLEEDLSRAREVLGKLPQAGIDLEAATQRLEDEGVEKFSSALARLMVSIDEKRLAVLAGAVT